MRHHKNSGKGPYAIIEELRKQNVELITSLAGMTKSRDHYVSELGIAQAELAKSQADHAQDRRCMAERIRELEASK